MTAEHAIWAATAALAVFIAGMITGSGITSTRVLTVEGAVPARTVVELGQCRADLDMVAAAAVQGGCFWRAGR